MKRYDLEDLANPSSYAADEELRALAISVAGSSFVHGSMRRSEWRDQFLAGQKPAEMKVAVDRLVDEQVARTSSNAAARVLATKITPPAGYAINIEDESLIINGPFNEDLHARIKRAGGYWDGQTGDNRRVWVLPLEKAAALKRIFGNAAKAAAEASAAAERARKAREEQAAAERVAREMRWAQEKAVAAQQRATERSERAARAKLRGLYPLSLLPPMNQPVRRGGSVVVFESTGQPFRIDEDHPSTHGSHLLGHEGERGCYCYYRMATADEIVALERAERAEADRIAIEQARQAEIESIRQEIQQNGECPAGQHRPVGERFCSTGNLHGSGSWFVVGHDGIWFIQNNGMDGDDWSRNNIITGGAGAIGWRVPYSEALAHRIKQQSNEED